MMWWIERERTSSEGECEINMGKELGRCNRVSDRVVTNVTMAKLNSIDG